MNKDSQLGVEYESMAERHELYAKFGIAAEAAQLFETELSTLLLCLRALEEGWHVVPDGESAKVALDEIDRRTLGRLLRGLKGQVELTEDLEARFSSALKARNRLTHGFYERHNFKIQTDTGRDEMIRDLDQLHAELFNAWQIAGAMTTMISDAILGARAKHLPGRIAPLRTSS
jgi:hypothetical protein